MWSILLQSSILIRCIILESLVTSYVLQSLIKKDRDDQNDPTISSFYEELATAYQDPALVPVRYSTNGERINSPLLGVPES